VVGLACCCLAALAIGLGGLYGYGNRTPATPVVVTPVVTAPVLTARAATDTALVLATPFIRANLRRDLAVKHRAEGPKRAPLETLSGHVRLTQALI
jgi:hypothetical protein